MTLSTKYIQQLLQQLQKRNIACTYFTYISKESQVSSVFCN
nr:MAG TPA: hypothetical protein [Bacteriophage sp.]